MRDIFTKVMTGSMIAGAALLVAACGGSGNNTAANTGTDNLTNDIGDTTNFGDTGNVGNEMNGTAGDLNQAANAVDNAADAIDNAQSNAGQ